VICDAGGGGGGGSGGGGGGSRQEATKRYMGIKETLSRTVK